MELGGPCGYIPEGIIALSGIPGLCNQCFMVRSDNWIAQHRYWKQCLKCGNYSTKPNSYLCSYHRQKKWGDRGVQRYMYTW